MITQDRAEDMLKLLYPDKDIKVHFESMLPLSASACQIFRDGGEVFVADGKTWREAIINTVFELEP